MLFGLFRLGLGFASCTLSRPELVEEILKAEIHMAVDSILHLTALGPDPPSTILLLLLFVSHDLQLEIGNGGETALQLLIHIPLQRRHTTGFIAAQLQNFGLNMLDLLGVDLHNGVELLLVELVHGVRHKQIYVGDYVLLDEHGVFEVLLGGFLQARQLF